MTTRTALPNRRPTDTFAVEHRGQRYMVTVGYFDLHTLRIGEVFISGKKTGSGLEATARDGAVLISIALQHGVPLDVMCHAITREQDGSASTIVGHVLDVLGGER